MHQKTSKLLFILLFLFFFSCKEEENKDFVVYKTNAKNQNVYFFWKDDKNKILKSIGNLKKYTNQNKQKLLFATNGGMYTIGNVPKGLYIENFKKLKALDTLSGEGNFYIQPNGIFFITKDNTCQIIDTKHFKWCKNIKFATQSGPLLLINGNINTSFHEPSRNLNIRNGVGIFRNGEVVFVMSKKEINFYDFASYFKKIGCQNALYLDGFVSRTYLPEKNWMQEDGNFGVMIAVMESKFNNYK
ncbi:phosphodiester glycosidase family protein [Flavobacterium sp.]|uniref:phosphodiester glycosidase family protein n=1 Tax=Flavobacterium sp. TaxID=239 RepID=UPI002638C49A|nr:phosphodiester glycosidase family protein [Flavobacterium sp.]